MSGQWEASFHITFEGLRLFLPGDFVIDSGWEREERKHGEGTSLLERSGKEPIHVILTHIVWVSACHQHRLDEVGLGSAVLGWGLCKSEHAF